MDDFTAEVLASGQDNTRAEQQAQPQVDDEPPTPRRGIRASKASLQDRLVEK